MSRGYSAVGLYRPKHDSNVGSVLRAAGVYGAGMVAIDGARGSALRHASNTMAAHKHIPTFRTDDLISCRPFDCQIVVVELIDGAEPLPAFKHPERAMYVFGPEDGTLGYRHTIAAQHVVYIPGRACMNLAATVNVVLYDRMVKRGEWMGSSVVEHRTENAGAVGSIPTPSTKLAKATS